MAVLPNGFAVCDFARGAERHPTTFVLSDVASGGIDDRKDQGHADIQAFFDAEIGIGFDRRNRCGEHRLTGAGRIRL
jgi:hypothetical protein